MKTITGKDKTTTPAFDQKASAGPRGTSIAPPAYGIERFSGARSPSSLLQDGLQARERTLPGEAWHVAQRKQAQVKPSSKGNVVQARFDRQSVHKALTDATGPANDMGGTTGGAYDVHTGVRDPDRARLVVKVAGGISSVLASRIASEIGIAAPQSVMVPAEPGVLGNLRRLNSTLGNALGSQTTFDVQQHASLETIQNRDAFGRLRPGAVLGRIAVFDALTGNHDRIYSTNRSNLFGSIAIDNATRTNTREAQAMMDGAIRDLSAANGALINYVTNPIANFNRETYTGSPTRQRQGLLVQREMLLQVQVIQQKSRDLREVIASYNREQDEQTQALIDELSRLERLSEPDPASPLEAVIRKVQEQNRSMTRLEIIQSNLNSRRRELGTQHFPDLIARLDVIERTDFSRELAAVERAIDDIEQRIRAADQQRLTDWQDNRGLALARSRMAWKDKIFKFYTNERAYVDGLMTTWESSHPRPAPTPLI